MAICDNLWQFAAILRQFRQFVTIYLTRCTRFNPFVTICASPAAILRQFRQFVTKLGPFRQSSQLDAPDLTLL